MTVVMMAMMDGGELSRSIDSEVGLNDILVILSTSLSDVKDAV